MSFDVSLLKMDGDDDGSGQVVTVEENLPSAHIDDDDDDINDDGDDDGGGDDDDGSGQVVTVERKTCPDIDEAAHTRTCQSTNNARLRRMRMAKMVLPLNENGISPFNLSNYV